MAAHHTAMNADDPSGADTYDLMLGSLAGIARHLADKFPDTLIIPAFGNNDSKYHDNPQPMED